MLANLKAKDSMDDVTMTRLCCFLTHFDAEPQLESHSIFLPPAVPTQQVKVAKSRLPSPVMSCRIFFTLHSLQYLPPFSALQSHVYSSILPSVPDLFFWKDSTYIVGHVMVLLRFDDHHHIVCTVVGSDQPFCQLKESPWVANKRHHPHHLHPSLHQNPILILTLITFLWSPSPDHHPQKRKSIANLPPVKKWPVTLYTEGKRRWIVQGTNLCRRSVICCHTGERWVGGGRETVMQPVYTHPSCLYVIWQTARSIFRERWVGHATSLHTHIPPFVITTVKNLKAGVARLMLAHPSILMQNIATIIFYRTKNVFLQKSDCWCQLASRKQKPLNLLSFEFDTSLCEMRGVK